MAPSHECGERIYSIAAIEATRCGSTSVAVKTQ